MGRASRMAVLQRNCDCLREPPAPGPDRNAALLGSAPVLSAAISCALYLLGAGAFVGQTRRWRVAALTTIPHSGYLLVDTFSLLGGTFGSTFG